MDVRREKREEKERRKKVRDIFDFIYCISTLHFPMN